MNKGNKSLAVSQRLCALVFFVYISEMVFGGALGLQPFGLPLRKIVFLLFILCFVVYALFDQRFNFLRVGLVLSLSLFLLIWSGLVPVMTNVNLYHSIAEVTPIVGLMAVFPMIVALRRNGVMRYLDFTNRCVAVVAGIVITTWATATYFNAIEIAIGVKMFYGLVSGDDYGMYIGPMPDGSVRVMWITCILFPFMLIYKNYRRIDLRWTAFYLVAIYATGTRAFLYISVVITIVLVVRFKPWLAVIAFPAVVFFVQLFLVSNQDVRMLQVADEFESNSPRLEQFFALMRLFSEYPLFGAGFGAHADILRSTDAPFSYELTYVALLAKLGLVGFSILSVLLAVGLCLSLAKHRNIRVIIYLAIFAFLFVTATNPYLINSVGMAILSFMIASSFSGGNFLDSNVVLNSRVPHK